MVRGETDLATLAKCGARKSILTSNISKLMGLKLFCTIIWDSICTSNLGLVGASNTKTAGRKRRV